MRRETKPCPFYGMPCEYVPMAEKADAAAAEIERLEAALREIEYMDRPQVRGQPRRVSIQDKARAALEERT